MLPISNLELIIVLIIFTWLAGITFFGIRFLRFFNKLTAGSDNKDIKSLLEGILKQVGILSEEKGKIIKKIEELEEKNHFYVQKIGLIRFNPFSDTGGNQSFVLALLDGDDNGFVITGLHGRDQTRIFTKPVEKGKEIGYEFSKEEIEAIVKAKKGGVFKNK